MSDYEQALAKLAAFVRARISAFGTPGLVLAITDRERTIHVAAYGQAKLESQAPATAETRFEIGSIGKVFTAIALLQQHELGKLALHAPVTTYLPWFKAGFDDKPITIHHLLSHTSGLTAGSDQATDARYEVWDLRNVYALPPGGKFHYSNVGYKVLGLVLQAVTGLPYGAAIRQAILDPLGMTSTFPLITHEMRLQQATGYAPLYDDRPVGRHDPLVPAPWLETDTGDGSISSSAADMAAFTRMLLNSGQGDSARLLSAESFTLLMGRHVEIDEGTYYGYGVLRQEEDHLYIGHGGDMPGFQAELRIDFDAGFGVCLLLNGPGRPSALGRYALTLLRAAQEGHELPEPTASNDPTRVAEAAQYAGLYADGRRTLSFVAEDDQIFLDYEGTSVVLEARGGSFYAAHPDFSRFLFTFGRDAAERVVEVGWGSDWYRGANYAGPTLFEVADAWRAYVGHYRAHNPWVSNFRVVLRKGQLLLIGAAGEEAALAPIADGNFQVGTEPTPERLRFDTLVAGEAWHARLSGGDYYRFFTP
jgi:D-alanyl-D-alanine carboxypeptidase